MAQLDCFIVKGEQGKVCLLQKSLYGPKQSMRKWYSRFYDFMKKLGFKRNYYYSCVYVKWITREIGIFLLLYVDDILIASTIMIEI